MNNLWMPVDKILRPFLDYFFLKFSFLPMINQPLAYQFLDLKPAPGASEEFRAKEAFRAEFKRALASCIKNRFSVEESFGLIWEETLQEIKLSDAAQAELYDELITWAKRWVR